MWKIKQLKIDISEEKKSKKNSTMKVANVIISGRVHE